MKKNKLTRREFIKVTSATTAAIAIGSPVSCTADKKSDSYDSKDLPTRELGQTGVKIPLMAFGTGSRFCALKDEEKSLEMLTYALDHGFYYWDTAHIYSYDPVVSEERLGKILKTRRNEVFLSTKIRARDTEEAKAQLELSLKRLQTDHLDILKIHNLQDVEDLKEITKKGGVYDLIKSMKDQKVTRFIGFSGHNDSQAMTRAASDFEFDTMLCALNHYSNDGDTFEEDAFSAASKKKMGVMAMKAIRPREKQSHLKADDLIKYALSLDNVNGVIVGMDSMEVLKSNIELVRHFKPLSASKMNELRMSLVPYYRSKELEWLNSGYEDGVWS